MRKSTGQIERVRAAMPQKVVLHVGMTKAGSSAVQNSLEANYAYLLNNRVLFPRSVFLRNSPLVKEMTPGHLQLVRDIVDDNLDAFHRELTIAEGRADRIVISAENIFLDMEDDWLFSLKQLFDGKDVEMFCILRSQESWCASRYYESVVKGNKKETRTFGVFVDDLIARGQLDYYERLKYVASAVGARTVRAADYDRVRKNGGAVKAMLDLLGLEGPLPLSISESQGNVSYPLAEGIEAHRNLNLLAADLPRDAYFAWCGEMEAIRAAARAEHALPAAHLRPDRAMMQRIFAACAASNRRLSEEFLGGAPFGPSENALQQDDPAPLDGTLVGALASRGVEALAPHLKARLKKLPQLQKSLDESKQALADQTEKRISFAAKIKALETQVEEKAEEGRRERKRADEAQGRLLETVKKCGALEVELSTLRREAKAKAAHAKDERKANAAKLKAAAAEIARLKAEISALDYALAAMRASTSWRVTAPLRAVKAPVAAVKRRLSSRAAIRTVAASPLFDAQWYLSRYPDVGAAGAVPARHYVLSGAGEGRDPGPDFSTKGYLAANPDIAASGMNPLHHYIVHGAKEGRKWRPVKTQSSQASSAKQFESEILDLERKLWGGFSTYAAKSLQRISLSKDAPVNIRARAAYELARWHSNTGEAAKVIEDLEVVKKYKPLARDKKARLLHFDALLATEKLEEAHRRIADALECRSNDSDYLLALANYWRQAAALGVTDQAEADDQRLAAINKVFEAEGLAPLHMSAEAAPLNLGGIRCATPRQVDGPKISVLMAAYGAEEHLHLAVDSILAQTWRNLELIIVEDRSPDGTWELMRRYAEQDPRVRIERNPENLGAYMTRNRALALATGEYVTVHDSDDWSHPEMLERQMAPLLAPNGPRCTFSMMARVTEDMAFGIRPSRRNLEIVHRSYPSLLMKKADLDLLGVWDGVRANADAEMVFRARRRFGDNALQDVLPATPMSFFLTRPESLTQQAQSSLLSLTFGVRHEYDRQADYIRSKDAEGKFTPTERIDKKTPFAAPELLLPHRLRTSSEYDLIIVSDLSLKGGTRSCNLGYIDVATDDGRRVGLFHWPRGDLRLLPDIDPAYRERNQRDNVDILTWEEEVRCRRVIVHHPPIMAHALDRFPKIVAESGAILVNQLPFQLLTREQLFYDVAAVDKEFDRLFGFLPTWIPISPIVRRYFEENMDASRIADRDWFPPLVMESAHRSRRPEPGRNPVVGRHSRDHWTKWPETGDALRGAYLVNDDLRVRILGGAKTPLRVFGRAPSNWDIHDFDTVDVASFIDGLDFFVHFTHSQYIEEFGRNVAEAMVRGVPAILPARFKETFGDAAIYCEPAEVRGVIERLWRDQEAYMTVARRGQEFVAAKCGKAAVLERLRAPLRAQPARSVVGA